VLSAIARTEQTEQRQSAQLAAEDTRLCPRCYTHAVSHCCYHSYVVLLLIGRRHVQDAYFLLLRASIKCFDAPEHSSCSVEEATLAVLLEADEIDPDLSESQEESMKNYLTSIGVEQLREGGNAITYYQAVGGAAAAALCSGATDESILEQLKLLEQGLPCDGLVRALAEYAEACTMRGWKCTRMT
jgi:hypothetical protein